MLRDCTLAIQISNPQSLRRQRAKRLHIGYSNLEFPISQEHDSVLRDCTLAIHRTPNLLAVSVQLLRDYTSAIQIPNLLGGIASVLSDCTLTIRISNLIQSIQSSCQPLLQKNKRGWCARLFFPSNLDVQLLKRGRFESLIHRRRNRGAMAPLHFQS